MNNYMVVVVGNNDSVELHVSLVNSHVASKWTDWLIFLEKNIVNEFFVGPDQSFVSSIEIDTSLYFLTKKLAVNILLDRCIIVVTGKQLVLLIFV
jgi:hypothetical protein